MMKAIFLDYTGTITQENCKAVQEVVMRIVKNSVLETPQEALSYWWSNLRQMEEMSYLDTYKTEDEIVAILLKRCEKEIKLSDNLEELHRLFQDFWTYSPVYPDAKEFFEKCQLPIYILTNNGVQYVQECMRLNGLKPAGIICGDMAKAYKPHKELFEKALEVSGCRADEVLHIGDSMSSDVKGALNVGITPILIDREGKEPSDSVKTIKELTESLSMYEKITLCGDNCIECPRYNAHSEEELKRVAELWHRVGWRNSIVSNEAISCSGCSSHKQCTYRLVECIKGHDVEKCNHCDEFPCQRISDLLKQSKEYQKKCMEVCTESEYESLAKAFFHKESNLRK